MPWGDVPIRDSSVTTVDIGTGESKTEELIEPENETEGDSDAESERGTITINNARQQLGFGPVGWGNKLVSRDYQQVLEVLMKHGDNKKRKGFGQKFKRFFFELLGIDR